MPLDPNTGLYEQSQGSIFPQGVFGGALNINNARIAQDLADEARSRRMLQDQMSEFQLQDTQSDLEYQATERQRANDQAAREEGWRKWNEANPNAPTEDRLKQSLAHGVKDTSVLSNMVYREGLLENKSERLQVDRSKEARQEVNDLFTQGFTGQEIADQLEPKYGAAGISPLYWQKIRSYKQSPMTAATIAGKGAQAESDRARAARDMKKNVAPAESTKVDQMLLQYDKAISTAQAKVQGLPILQQRAAKKNSVDPLIATRDVFAAKHGRPLIGQKPPTPTVVAPVNPSPSTTTAAPLPPSEKKYKPNSAYGDKNGNVVFYTDANGNRIQ